MTSLYVVDRSFASLASRLQHDVDVVSAWFDRWLLSVNTAKSATMVIRSRGMSAEPLKITSGSSELCQVKSHRHLDVVFNETLTWSDHVDHVNKASWKLGLLRRLRGRS